MRILVVEDNLSTRELIVYKLKSDKHDITCSVTGIAAIECIKTEKPELIILDLNLPDIEGLAVCNLIRENPEHYGNPVIIIITSRKEEEDVIDGFNSGADDYIKKPFNINELILKISAWEKRIKNRNNTIYKYKTITIDSVNRNVEENELTVELQKQEFDLLLYMIKNKGLLLTRSKIMWYVWDKEFLPGDRSIDTCIKKLRKKVETIKDDIKTIKGFGYKLKA